MATATKEASSGVLQQDPTSDDRQPAWLRLPVQLWRRLWDSLPNTRKKVLCFVDDDPDELARFRAAMSGEFIVIIGLHYHDCVRELNSRGLTADLWVLDLFFPEPGCTNTPQQLAEMIDRYAALERHAQEFRAFLASIGQGADGGISLLRMCLSDYRTPAIMFTRKGTLDDGIRCLDAKASLVIKKPMPANLPDEPLSKKEALDRAMMESSPYLRTHFHDVIKKNTWWAKHGPRVMFWLGLAALLVGLVNNVRHMIWQ